MASLDIHDPKKRFMDKKCNQKISKKLSVAKTVYKLSRLKYKLKMSNIDSSNSNIWRTTNIYADDIKSGKMIEFIKNCVKFELGAIINSSQNGMRTILDVKVF